MEEALSLAGHWGTESALLQGMVLCCMGFSTVQISKEEERTYVDDHSNRDNLALKLKY